MGSKFIILGSGSKGNSAYLESNGFTLLIDAGLSAKQILDRIYAKVGPFSKIDAILLTHEHTDHIQGLVGLIKRFNVPIICNRFTAEALPHTVREVAQLHIFETGNIFELGPLKVETFPVPHDAMDPVGFLIHVNGCSLAWLTDLGHATILVKERARKASLLVLEANHDEYLLKKHPRRPWSLKQRIMSRHGHLSNKAAADLLCEIYSERIIKVWLSHLSQECNSPSLALQTVKTQLLEWGHSKLERIDVALQNEPTQLLEW